MKNIFHRILGVFLLVAFVLANPLFAQENNTLYASASTEEQVVILEPSYTSNYKSFEKKYHYLVARAYFRLLSEAQKSERKLRLEFEKYTYDAQKLAKEGDTKFQNNYNLVCNKYKAHSAMLSGLKSWNLFSDDRTGDMYYFMAENEERIYQMFKGKLSDDKMVKHLIYKLANLYHLEGEN